MASPVLSTVTQYPAGEPTVYVGPLMQQVGFDQLLRNSVAVGNLQAQLNAMQAQINDLIARVTALEGGQ